MDNPESQKQESQTLSHSDPSGHSELVSESHQTKQSFNFQFRKLYLLIAFLVLLAGLTLTCILISPFTQNPKPQQASLQPSPTVNSTQTPIDETANWKTYTNTKYGYTIKYPNGFFIIEKSYNGFNTTIISNTTDPKYLTIYPNATSNEFSIFIRNAYSDTDLETARKSYGSVIKTEDYNIGRIKGFRVTGESGNDIGDTVIVYKNKEYVFQLNTEKSQYVPYFEQILSTFKFLE